MKIKCPECDRFLVEINIEEYIADLEKLEIEQQTPLIIRLPCKICRKPRSFNIYKGKIVTSY